MAYRGKTPALGSWGSSKSSHGRVINPIRCVSSFTKINVLMLMRYYWHCNLSNPPSHHRLPCSPCPPMTQSRSDTRMRHSMPSFDIFSSRHLNLAVRGKIDDRNRHDLRCSTFDDRYWSQGKVSRGAGKDIVWCWWSNLLMSSSASSWANPTRCGWCLTDLPYTIACLNCSTIVLWIALHWSGVSDEGASQKQPN